VKEWIRGEDSLMEWKVLYEVQRDGSLKSNRPHPLRTESENYLVESGTQSNIALNYQT